MGQIREAVERSCKNCKWFLVGRIESDIGICDNPDSKKFDILVLDSQLCNEFERYDEGRKVSMESE